MCQFDNCRVYSFFIGCLMTVFHFSGATFLASDRYISRCNLSIFISLTYTLYDYWNFISFLIQQTFVYLVLKFIFILVCSHYRNRTLSVLHNLRNSIVCTDKKINWATAVPTRNQPWPYLYHFTLFWNRTTPQQQLKST